MFSLVREIEHRARREVESNAAQSAPPVHAHARRLDVRDERAEKRDGDEREVPPDDEGEDGAHEEPGEPERPVEVPPRGAPRGRLREPERERREVERGVRGEKQMERSGATRSSEPIIDATRQNATVTPSAAAGSPRRRANGDVQKRNGAVLRDGVQHPRRGDETLQRLRETR